LTFHIDGCQANADTPKAAAKAAPTEFARRNSLVMRGVKTLGKSFTAIVQQLAEMRRCLIFFNHALCLKFL
jgi:hypothetical protein